MNAAPQKSVDEIRARVDRVMEVIENGPLRADPPISQSLEDITDPWFGLGTHPDIIERMWKLDNALAQRCRWVFWRQPALLHPDTGGVFAVGFGTIGYV